MKAVNGSEQMKAAEASGTTVKPKASKRKSRSETVEHRPRTPLQSRGHVRFELIISTFEQMLQASDIENISFYDIAERAGVSPASINYFFPTLTALRVEVIRRYLSGNAEYHRTAFNEEPLIDPSLGWQYAYRESCQRYRAHLHANRHKAEILLGPMIDLEVRRACIRENDEVAKAWVDILEATYVLPPIDGLVEALSYSVDCLDALWSRSYAAEGCVSDAAFEASVEVTIAYLRTLLPERLQVRPGAHALRHSQRWLDTL